MIRNKDYGPADLMKQWPMGSIMSGIPTWIKLEQLACKTNVCSLRIQFLEIISKNVKFRWPRAIACWRKMQLLGVRPFSIPKPK
jgi:hypothetical protein